MKTTSLKKILIANRGEIACRIIRSAKQMGLRTVAVYSEADCHAQHVKLADEAYYIGAAPSKDSYLDIDKIIKVAQQCCVDCIHPGYGFLSENSEFALACEQHNITFIGPNASSIAAMGSKTKAKEIMAKANVPLIPGYYGEQQDPDFLYAQAEQMGYPILIKAAYGGGGKGMRIVNHPAEFAQALQAAKREAKAGFANDLVLLERYIDQPRHVEVQIFADNYGHCIYLGDRDCSLQRRHQKVIEEAPAPGLSKQLRQAMGEAAVRCALAIDYRGAGTVEFLLCQDEFFFMEMNTRLQVEHPVTEMITGIDLVQWQINIASGQALALRQDEVQLHGHSFEARIYAEDPQHDFIPCSGTITAFHQPQNSRFVRIDTAIALGDEISPYYDPMIAKLVVYDDTREQALARLKHALSEFHLAGVNSNISFLLQLAQHPDFNETAPSTHFIAQQGDALLQQDKSAQQTALLIAAFVYLNTITAPHQSIWQQLAGFSLNAPANISFELNEHKLSGEKNATGYSVNYNEQHFSLHGSYTEQSVTVYINGAKHHAHISNQGQQISVMYQAFVATYTIAAKHYVSQHEQQAAPLAAPLNGTVVKHLVAVGDHLAKGDPVVIIEAMKMEYTLTAPYSGVLASYSFAEGALVSHGALLGVITPAEEDA